MSHNQHSQSNRHGKYSTRGERYMAKMGIRVRSVGLRKLARELIKRKPNASDR